MSVVMQKILDTYLSPKMNLALLPTLKDIHNRHVFDLTFDLITIIVII